MKKRCVTCKQEKDLDEFWKNKSRPDGKHSQCISCIKAAYKPKTKEKANRDAKAYALRHPEKIKERWKKWYAKNKETLLTKKYTKDKTPEAIEKRKSLCVKNRNRINEQRRIRKKNPTPKQKAEKIVRDRFYKVVVRMKSGKKFVSSLVVLGCSIDFFKKHIEGQFRDGMSWDNHGNGEGKWNIDHITPLVKFNLFDLEEQKKAFHYSNMRPLWFMDNMQRPRKHHYN